MGIFNVLFGSGGKKKSNSISYDKNNIYHISYAFGCMASQVGAFETSYIQVKINHDDVMIQVLLNSDYCKNVGIKNLNSSQDLLKLRVPNDIASFVPTLNGIFSMEPYYALEIRVPIGEEVPVMQEIVNSIQRSQRTVKFMIKYSVTANPEKGILFVEVRD